MNEVFKRGQHVATVAIWWCLGALSAPVQLLVRGLIQACDGLWLSLWLAWAWVAKKRAVRGPMRRRRPEQGA